MKREQLSEGIDEISTARTREPFSIPKSANAKPKRAARPQVVVARKLSKRLGSDEENLPSLPEITEADRVGVAKTYVLHADQRSLIERHALQRFNLGLTGRIDYSAPLRDIVDFFMANEKEGNAFIANKFKNQGNR